MGYLKEIKDEWPTVREAPWSFATMVIGGLVAGFVAGAGLLHLVNSGSIEASDKAIKAAEKTIESLNTMIRSRDDDLKSLKDKLQDLENDSASSTAPAVEKQVGDGPASVPPELSLAADQLAKMEVILKANPSLVEIRKGGKTPKILANQIQSSFNISNWKVQLIETADTQDWLILTAQGRAAGGTIAEALDAARVRFRSYESSDGTISFHLSTN
jgi:septal ring factor EnvC (AmiA/AmiB activator)